MTTDSINDTICAISTPPGIGGIAVIRISGPEAIDITNRIWKGRDLTTVETHTAHLGELIDRSCGEAIDQCVATIFKAPRSYTGEETVELAIHGSKWIQREALALLQRNGCRMAEAGEYTRRAVMNGRLDLAQAEGVADVIASNSRAAHRIAMNQMKGGISRRLATLREQLVQLSVLLELELDFSEEDVEFADRGKLISIATQIEDELTRLYNSFSKGNAIKEGIPVAIIGATNAGKSSLLNALLDDDRAIVSDIHGTTRDTIEESVEIGDYLFRFIDTAGLRDTTDPIERIGIERSRKALSQARIVIALIDATTIDADNNDLQSLLPAELSTYVTSPQTAPSSDVSVHTCDIIVGLNKTDLISENKVSEILAGTNHNGHIGSTTSKHIESAHNGHIHSSSSENVLSIDNIHSDNNGDPRPIENENSNDNEYIIDRNQSSTNDHIRPNCNGHIKAILPISAKQGIGLGKLRDTLLSIADTDTESGENSDVMVTNLRQAEALRQAIGSLRPLIEGLQNGLETDLAAQHLRETLTHLATITGEIPSTEILNTIFSSFCIGK